MERIAGVMPLNLLEELGPSAQRRGWPERGAMAVQLW